MVLVYNMFIIPFRMAFVNKDELDFSLAVDYLGDIVFMLDSRLRMTAFAFMEGDKVVTDQKKIRARYMKKSVYDVLSVLPVEWLSVVFMDAGDNGGLRAFQIFSMFRMLKMLRVQWMDEHIRCSDSVFLSYANNAFKNELKVSKLLMTILLSSHWLGCIFFFIAYLEQSAGQENWADCNGGVLANHLFDCSGGNLTSGGKPTEDKYIRSVYWAATALTTAGYGDVSARTDVEQAYR